MPPAEIYFGGIMIDNAYASGYHDDAIGISFDVKVSGRYFETLKQLDGISIQ